MSTAFEDATLCMESVHGIRQYVFAYGLRGGVIPAGADKPVTVRWYAEFINGIFVADPVVRFRPCFFTRKWRCKASVRGSV